MITDSFRHVERNCGFESIHSSHSCRTETVAENAALRQQLAVFKRKFSQPKLNNRDRLFWIGLCMVWQEWKSALILVRPETVTCWHRERFRPYWRNLSQPKNAGRLGTRSEVRKLIHATASPT